jgi:hypothetical protein
MPRQFQAIGPAIQDERVEYGGHVVVLRPLPDYVGNPGSAPLFGIVRPDGELALAFERDIALQIAADYFSHGAL